MSDKLKHHETVHINEVTRTAKGTVQWFLDKENSRDGAQHPITHNNQLQLFICGKEGFEQIAADIANAKYTIDLCCWGFDPGMELVRKEGKENALWPRGETFGDLLIAASERGVKVRLLVWRAPVSSGLSKIYFDLLNPKNLPGWTHEKLFTAFDFKQQEIGEINAVKILSAERNDSRTPGKLKQMARIAMDDENSVARKARAIYCSRWFSAARCVDGRFENITVRDRQSDSKKVEASFGGEKNAPIGTEYIGMVALASHHQKSILIDYAGAGGKNAVGYVMGLNSVTDYWDTVDHEIENTQREDGMGSDREKNESVQALTPAAVAADSANASSASDPGFRTYKPYRDYACRIKAGGALIAVHENFESAWLRTYFKPDDKLLLLAKEEQQNEPLPAALTSKGKRSRQTRYSTVQIVRTQPDESDKTIKDLYLQATSMAVNIGGYLYIENQYFQYEEWSQQVLEYAYAKAALWKKAAEKSGKNLEDMPVLNIFIVIPVAEREQMVPRTYDTLATLGQQAGMRGQENLIKDANKEAQLNNKGRPDVVEHANGILKPSAIALEAKGLRVVVSMLQTSGSCIDLKGQRRMRYREIYIHSKLMLINDSFFTLGSANLNQRSMCSDSELNMGCNDRKLSNSLRKRIWSQLSGRAFDGGSGSRAELKNINDEWEKLQEKNRIQKLTGKPMKGFLLPVEDVRSATIRLG